MTHYGSMLVNGVRNKILIPYFVPTGKEYLISNLYLYYSFTTLFIIILVLNLFISYHITLIIHISLYYLSSSVGMDVAI